MTYRYVLLMLRQLISNLIAIFMVLVTKEFKYYIV